MKTQLSRNSFDAKKRYSGIYQQMGRMLTDADWNELTATIREVDPREVWITHGRDDALARWAELNGYAPTGSKFGHL